MLKTALLSCILASCGSAYCFNFGGFGGKCNGQECAVTAPSDLVVKINKSAGLPTVAMEYECYSDLGGNGQSSSKSMRSLSFNSAEELEKICKEFAAELVNVKKNCGKNLKANLRVDSSLDEAQVKGIICKYFAGQSCDVNKFLQPKQPAVKKACPFADKLKCEEKPSLFAKREPVKPEVEMPAAEKPVNQEPIVEKDPFGPESFEGYFEDMAKKMNHLFKGLGLEIEPGNEVMTLEEPPVNADKPAVKQRGFKKYPKKYRRGDFVKENGPFVGIRWYPRERFAFDLNSKLMKYTLEKVLSQYLGGKVICSMHNGNVTILVKEVAGKSNSDYEKMVTDAINTIKANGGLVNDPNFSIASGEVREQLEARDFDLRKIDLGEINARFNAIFAGGPSEIVAKLR